MCPQHKSENGSEQGLPPGAERFWGQFSESKAGRTTGEEDARTGPRETEEPAGNHHECLEWCPICRSAELLRATASPEIRQQIQSIQNDAIQILKAFAATYAERTGDDPHQRSKPETNGDTGPPPPEEPKVTDISIE